VLTAPTVSVVIPARNMGATIGRVLGALAAERPAVDEVIVVDDGSNDATASTARSHGARVLRAPHRLFAGGARNLGWDHARGDVVVFLDADDVPQPGWGAGLRRALEEFPHAIVGCARTFEGATPWEWVAYLQNETPRLPRGVPRRVAFVPSYSLAVPREVTVRFDPSYGGEDALFCADARRQGHAVVFDPRWHTRHMHGRRTFVDLRRLQRRNAASQARCGIVQGEGLHKRMLTRVPLHYFLLARLVVIHRRVRDDPVLRRQFRWLLPRLVLAEWMLGVSAARWMWRRPVLRTPRPA
jgi:glycosyltransferase involved in cell wall biosynthesis